MKQFNYATLLPNDKIKFKDESELTTYEVLKKELDDATLDVRRIGELDVWFDDCFLFQEEPKPSFIIKNFPLPMLTDYDILICGPIVFASCDEEGETISLTSEALNEIKKLKPALLGENIVWVYENF